MNKRKLIIVMILNVVLLIISSCGGLYEKQTNDEIEVEQIEAENNTLKEETLGQYTDASISPDSLKYLGAFLLPDYGTTEKQMYSYGGEGMCFNPANNSLFITGHNWYAYVAEISIPEPVIKKDTTKMNKAEALSEFRDIRGSLFDDWTMEIPRAGLEVIGGRLFFCFGEHFEENTAKGTHGYTDLNLSPAKEACIIGDYLYSTNDYIFKIPDDYIDLFGGNDLMTGRFRDGGWSGMGPSVFAVLSDDIVNAQNDERTEAVPVIKYDDSFNGDDGHKMYDYSHADSWTGAAFVSCSAGSSIVFVGTHSYGSTWYGFSNGVVYPTDGDDDDIYPEVPDYPHDQRGWWSDDFRACMILYSTDDAVKSYKGDIQAYEMQPYAFIDLSEYMIVEKDNTVMQHLGAAAYDSANNRIYVLELMADGDKPVVHVFAFE